MPAAERNRPRDPRVYEAAIRLAEGKAAEARDGLLAVVAAEPGNAEALHLLATLAFNAGEDEEGVALAERAIAADGATVLYHRTLAQMLKSLGRWAALEAAGLRALRVVPDDAGFHHLLGEALRVQGRNAEAENCYRRAHTIDPTLVGPLNGLGVVLDEQGRTEEAEATYREALALGEEPGLHYNLGNVLMDQHRADDAIAQFRRAIALDPDFAEAHVQLAFTLILKGDMEAAWAEYEWRWRVPTFGRAREFQASAWDGAAPEGKTLLIHAEQGFGDTLQFARYVPVAHAMGARVLFECQPALKRLMATLPGADAVVSKGEALPPHDLQAPLLSMPRLVGTTLATVPADVPYLFTDADGTAAWTERLSGAPGHKIGIAWRGTGEKRGNIARACPLAAFRPLWETPGVRLVVVQKDVAPDDRPLPDAVTDLSGQLNDFADTADVLGAVDLVISIDTAVAHLAGALGRPTWLLLSTAGDWRWMMGRDDSPWYPTVRIFRQEKAGDWDGVIARVASEIGRFRAEGG